MLPKQVRYQLRYTEIDLVESGGIRTAGLRLAKPPLSQLSYDPIESMVRADGIEPPTYIL